MKRAGLFIGSYRVLLNGCAYKYENVFKEIEKYIQKLYVASMLLFYLPRSLRRNCWNSVDGGRRRKSQQAGTG